MPGVSADQVKQAREVDLLSYLQANEPHELTPLKNGEYRTITHGSLVISNGLWRWNRGGFGGRSALDYLNKGSRHGFCRCRGNRPRRPRRTCFVPACRKNNETAGTKNL